MKFFAVVAPEKDKPNCNAFRDLKFNSDIDNQSEICAEATRLLLILLRWAQTKTHQIFFLAAFARNAIFGMTSIWSSNVTFDFF